MNLSVVIATKDRADYLERALDALEGQRDVAPFEVVVADNGSRDRTRELLAGRTERSRQGSDQQLTLRCVRVPEPNRGAARNAALAQASGELVVFVDDDVWLPAGFLAAHTRAHAATAAARVVSGPIVNVPAYGVHPKPTWANWSAAFFCTCNVSVPRGAIERAGGFDEGFDLYGWEDTELGLRLRQHGLRHAFAWDAYLWHIKPPQAETLEVVYGKTVERARMAVRLLRKDGGLRTRLATGAYEPNLTRAALVAPAWSLPGYRRLATDPRLPAALRAFARAQLLDGAYAQTLRRALAESA